MFFEFNEGKKETLLSALFVLLSFSAGGLKAAVVKFCLFTVKPSSEYISSLKGSSLQIGCTIEKWSMFMPSRRSEKISLADPLERWQQASVCVCACPDHCGNVVIKKMMSNMLMGPPAFSKHINDATVQGWYTDRLGFSPRLTPTRTTSAQTDTFSIHPCFFVCHSHRLTFRWDTCLDHLT